MSIPRSRSHRSSRRHYSRSRSRSHRRRSRSRSRSWEYRRHRSHSRSPMSNRRRHLGNRVCIQCFFWMLIFNFQQNPANHWRVLKFLQLSLPYPGVDLLRKAGFIAVTWQVICSQCFDTSLLTLTGQPRPQQLSGRVWTESVHH